MRLKLLPAGLLAMAMATSSLAGLFGDAIVRNLEGLGYTYIEIKPGPSEVTAEVLRGSEKLEGIHDLAAGTILKRETEQATGEYLDRSGVRMPAEDRDFLRGRDDDDGGSGRGGGSDSDGDHDDD